MCTVAYLTGLYIGMRFNDNFVRNFNTHAREYIRNAGIQNFSDFCGDYLEIREGSV